MWQAAEKFRFEGNAAGAPGTKGNAAGGRIS